MNILFLTRLYDPHIGGVETHVKKLSQALINLGHQVTIITTQYESSLSLEENVSKIKIIRIPKLASANKFSLYRWVWQHRNLISQYDIIHAHDVYFWLFPIRPFLSNTYITFHGWEGHFPPTIKAKLVRQLSANLATKNLCVGSFIPSWYQTKADQITFGATNQPYLGAGSRDKILVLSRLDTDVDIDTTIDGLKLIKQKFPKIKIIFAGDGNEAWKARQVGEVLGFVSNISAQLSTVQWVFTSSYLSILDSMAAGRFIFSNYSNPLKKEYLTSHPMSNNFSISYTADEIAASFQKYYFKPQLTKEAIQNNRNWAASQTWEKLAQEYLQLWK